MRISKPQQATLLALILCHSAMAQTLPSGGTVVKGSASIQQSGGSQTVTQTSDKAVINWQDFSIGAGGSVNFVQPGSSSIILNRVIGSGSSQIYGSLTANGQVFIVNPNGVYFGKGSSIDVGGLLATTMNIGNDDFMAGNYVFTRNNLSTVQQQVINEGVLKARDNGYIVLAGDYAANRGIVQAKLGTVALASGSKMTLDVQGDSLINFAVNEKTVAQLSGVDNSGQLLADGGRAIMTASVATDLQTAVVNNTGIVRANTAEERNGEIILSADGGNTQNSGTLDASGKGAGQTGGTIQVLGNKVALIDNAVLDASGDAGGGTINVGGNFQGNGPLANSQTAYVGQNVQIKADAITKGNGGNVVVWSDDWTRYYGSISAQGGRQAGDGGNVEVSGKALLDYNGYVNTLAAHGKTGTLLLDPTDINIFTSAPSPDDQVTGAPVFSDSTPANGGVSQMSIGNLETALGSSNVTVKTTSSGTAPSGGTITIDDGSGGGVQWGAATQLKLQADNQILIKSSVQGSNSGSSIWLDAAKGATQSAGTNLKAGSLLLTDGTNGTGNWTLVGSGNNFNTFAANLTTTGTLQFQNNQSMTVGSVTTWDGSTACSGSSTCNGIQRTGGDTQLNISSGSLSLAKDVNFGSTGTLYINASSGLTQQSGEKITGGSLFVTGGAVTLTNAGNNINTLAASINGALAYTDTDTLTVGTGRNGSNGITTNNHDVTIKTGDSTAFDPTKQPDTTNPASLVLNESINAGNGNVRITTGKGGTYQRHDVDSGGNALTNGSITASNLLLLGNNSTSVTPFVLSNSNNKVNTLAANANGSITFVGSGNSSNTVAIGTIDSTSGITATSNTVVSTTTTTGAGGIVTTTTTNNDNNVSLSIGGNLNINQNITASSANGSDSVSIGIGGDFTAQTASGKRITADTLGLFGDNNKGTFKVTTDVSNLAASGGKLMVIDNSVHNGVLNGIGIGASPADAGAINAAQSGLSNQLSNANSTTNPVGDFYLTTSGDLNIVKLKSQGQNLMLRSRSLSIALDAETADNARIMLQPYDLTSKIGIANGTEPGFTPGYSIDADTLLKFSNPVSTFYFGTPQAVIMNDANVPSAAKNTATGDIHIGYGSDFNLGYRSLSAETTGNMVVYNAGPLYNLQLAATNMTIFGFETYGNQIDLLTNNLSLPSATGAYINPNKPNITYRSLNDQTIWVGHSYVTNEPQILPSTLVKLPDGSTIIISGTTDYPFPNGGAGYGDIHIPWDDGIVLLGNRKLILSTGHTLYTYNATPTYTKKNDGGTSGGLWIGCQNLSNCMGTNPNPNPDPTPGGGGGGGGGGSGGGGGGQTTTPSGGCQGCPSAPINTNPYPPGTSNGDPGGDPNGDHNGTNPGDGNGDGSDGGGDGGGGLGGGGNGDGNNGSGLGGDGSGDGNNGNGLGDGGNGGSGDGSGDGGSGLGGGGTGDGNNGNGLGDGGAGDGNDGNGLGGGGNGGNGDGSGDGGSGLGGGGTGDGNNGNGLGNNGDGNGGNGSGGNGDGNGDGGAGTGNGGSGDGADNNGNGDGGSGLGGGGAGDGSNGNGLGDGGDGGNGNGSGGNGDGNGDGGAGTGNGGTGNGADHDGNGDGGSGNGNDGAGASGDGGAASNSGGLSDGAGNGGLGNGDGGDRSGNDGNGDGSDNAGDAGAGSGSGGPSDGKSGADDGNGNNGTAAPAVDISCGDVTQARKDQPESTDQKNGKNLIEIRHDGVRVQDPCQQQPQNQDGKH